MCPFTTLWAQTTIDLRSAQIVTSSRPTARERNALNMLVEEVERRTLIRWSISDVWPSDSNPVIVVGSRDWITGLRYSPVQIPSLLSQTQQVEGFQIEVLQEEPVPAVFVIGSDERGLLFGVGRLLRELHMARGKIMIPASLSISTSPKYALRGHQMGYRPKTNSYDGWTPEIWEQYIRDHIVFGMNAMELIPPRSDDSSDSPHFPLPPLEMMVRVSEILDNYGLDVWIWYPALDKDYSNPATVEFALAEWAEVFAALPRIDALFVPGGDPGHTRPRHMMDLLEQQTLSLKRYHPDAQMWMSPQGFNQKWMDEFYDIVQRERPSWLSGVVYGPQVRVTLPELRSSIPSQYLIRRYPDITHDFHSQYPVPDWDLAFALTEAREAINPRPLDQARIFQAFQDYAIGYITYSEGCKDDVNKVIWSALGWNPESNVVEVLRQYSRYFIGDLYEDSFAQGILALERNWRGPLLTNESVFTTLKQFQEMEAGASPEVLLNWRFQQALYRAYYDAYVRRRLLSETDMEANAMDTLRSAQRKGSLLAADQAQLILNRSEIDKPAVDWRARVFELAEALYQSIRMQLSVERYQAIRVSRGASLDTIDVPLNNRLWLGQQLSELQSLDQEAARLEKINKIVNWTNPGPGGYYDDLGNPSAQPHLLRGEGFTHDPGFMRSSLVGFGCQPGWRQSWCRHADALYDAPLSLHYSELDPTATYQVRVVYAGDNFRTRVQLQADGNFQVHPLIEKPRPPQVLEFHLPQEVTRDGELTLTWRQEPGRGGNGRGSQVAEVWLVKQSTN